MSGESAVHEELFEALSERLRRVRVFYLAEEDGDEVVVGCGVVNFDDEVWTAAVEDRGVGVTGEGFKRGVVVDESVGVAHELRVSWSVRGVEWFVEPEVAGAVVVNLDSLGV